MAKQANPSVSNQINMIGEGTVVEGTIQAESDLRVSGRIIGKLEVDGKVIVAQEGVVEGEIRAENVDVAGVIEGEVYAAERVVLKGSARFSGNVRAGRLVVEEGAVFNGRCMMGEEGAEAAASRDRLDRPEAAPNGPSQRAATQNVSPQNAAAMRAGSERAE